MNNNQSDISFTKLNQRRKIFLLIYFVFFSASIITGLIFLITSNPSPTRQPEVNTKITEQIKPAIVVTESKPSVKDADIKWIKDSVKYSTNLDAYTMNFEYPEGSIIIGLNNDIRFQPLKISNEYFDSTLAIPYESFSNTFVFDEVVELENISHLLKVYRIKNQNNYLYTSNIYYDECLIMGDGVEAPCGLKLVFPLVQKNNDDTTNFPFEFICNAEEPNVYLCDEMIKRVFVSYIEKTVPVSYVIPQENIVLSEYKQQSSRNNITWTLPYEYQKYEYSYRVVWSTTSGINVANPSSSNKSYALPSGRRYSEIYPFNGTGNYYVKLCVYKSTGSCISESNELKIYMQRIEPIVSKIELKYDKATKTFSWELNGSTVSGLLMIGAESHISDDGIPSGSYTYINITDDNVKSYKFEPSSINIKYGRVCTIKEFDGTPTKCDSVFSNEVGI